MSNNTTDTGLVTVILIIIGAFVVFPAVFMGFGMMGFGSMMGGWGHGMWGDGTAPGWMALVGLMMQLLFVVVLIAAGYLIYRAVTQSDNNSDQALEELRLAYARGDLTDEEYENRREALERDS